jgi:hypothetical protein
MEQSAPQSKPRTANLAAILTLLFFFPVGLYLMWAKTTWPKNLKWGITAVFAFLTLISLIGSASGSKQESAATHSPSPTTVARATPTSVKTNTRKNGSPDTANIPPKVLGSCSTTSTGNYTVAQCVDMQLPDLSAPSRLLYIVIDPSNDSPKSRVQALATQVNALCGKVSDCTINIFDEAQAANEQYKEDLLSQNALKQYIKDPKNDDATADTTEHLVATFTPPTDFSYLFVPSPTPTITLTPIAYDANGFPEDAERITVSDIAKVPSAYENKKVTFTCDVLSFPKDENGNAAGINCSDPNDYSSLVQVQMGAFDQTVKINTNDTVVVYGMGQGAAQGTNAFGGAVTEALVLELHLKDLTTGWSE